MKPGTKRNITYVIFGAYYMLGGIEYAVIMPTLYLYIETEFQAETYYMGVILAAYSFSGLFSGPIMGRLADITRKSKLLMFVCSCFMITGSVMYWVGLSANFLIAARLVAGCGAGFESIIIGELARSTAEAERTGVIALLVAVRQIGLLFGPGFNVFLREADFMIGSLPVNKYNAAGAFMAVVWCFVQILAIFFQYDLDKIQEELRKQECDKTDLKGGTRNENISYTDKQGEINYAINTQENEHNVHQVGNGEENCSNGKIVTYRHYVGAGNTGFQDNKTKHSLQLEEQIGQPKDHQQSGSEDTNDNICLQDISAFSSSEELIVMENSFTQERKTTATKLDYGTLQNLEENKGVKDIRTLTWKMIINEVLRDEAIAVVFVAFSCAFCQTGAEAAATPLTNWYLGWGELENSIMFTVGGIEILVVFLLVRWLSKYLQDRTLLCIGWVFLTAATCWWMYAVPSAALHPPSENMFRIVVGIFLCLFGLPFEAASAASLFSKLMSKEIQGVSQGLSRSLRGMAVILAPLWAGSTLQWPYLMTGVMLAINIIAMAMFLLSWPRLRTSSELEKEEVKKLIEP